MNILLINHYAGTPRMGMEYRPYYFAREWVKLGHKVTIVSSSFTHLRTVNAEMTSSIKKEEIDGIQYVWVKTPRYSGNNIKRILNIFSFIGKVWFNTIKLVEISEPDVVIASSTYPLDIFPAHRIAKKTNAKLVFEVHDLWPLSPIELGGYSKNHPYIMLMQYAEDFFCKKADIIVSMLPFTNKHLETRGMDKKKFNYIPNGYSDQSTDVVDDLPQEHKNIINGLKEKGCYLVGYAGSHGLANSLNSLIEAAEFLVDTKIVMVLTGRGPEKENLIEMTKKKKLTNVIFLPSIPKTAIPSLLDQMDLLFIGLQNQPLFQYGICPNKLIDYLLAEKPIVQAINAGNDIVGDNNCGITVEPENSKAISNAINRIANMTDAERKMMGKNGRRYVVENHNYHNLSRNFIEILN